MAEKCAAKIAEYGQFNCSCNGSYNYPVPPQYTYHWPGMYKLQAIPQYNSPYRYPALEQPAPAATPYSGEKAFPNSPEPAHLPPHTPSRVEQPSVKLKRFLGIQ